MASANRQVLILPAALVIALTGACASWHVVTEAPTPATQFDTTRTYLVHLKSGLSLEAEHLRVSNDSLMWLVPKSRDAKAPQQRQQGARLSEVGVIEESRGGGAVVPVMAFVVTAVLFFLMVSNGLARS